MNIDIIANLAHHSGAGSKTRTFEDLRGLVHSIDEDGPCDSSDRRQQLARIYAYFLPASPAKPKTSQDWVGKAAGIKDVRFYLNAIRSDGARLIATDGHRVHIFKTDKYPAGYYDKAFNKVEIDAPYVDIDRIIPVCPRQDLLVEIDVSTLEICSNPEHHKLFQHVYIIKQLRTQPEEQPDGSFVDQEYVQETRINKIYLDQALSGIPDPVFYIRGAQDAILIKSKTDSTLAAVIAPTRP